MCICGICSCAGAGVSLTRGKWAQGTGGLKSGKMAGGTKEKKVMAEGLEVWGFMLCPLLGCRVRMSERCSGQCCGKQLRQLRFLFWHLTVASGKSLNH